MTTVWCIRHRDGWCVTRDGAKPSEDAWSDPTACGHFVIMRSGSGIREPTCKECRKALEER